INAFRRQLLHGQVETWTKGKAPIGACMFSGPMKIAASKAANLHFRIACLLSWTQAKRCWFLHRFEKRVKIEATSPGVSGTGKRQQMKRAIVCRARFICCWKGYLQA